MRKYVKQFPLNFTEGVPYCVRKKILIVTRYFYTESASEEENALICIHLVVISKLNSKILV